MESLEQLGEAVRQEGPLDGEDRGPYPAGRGGRGPLGGVVHSHVRRARAAGATPGRSTTP